MTEFLADPPTGLAGDANGDGERSAGQDEFVEFLNITDEAIDLSGKSIYDADALRHQIPEGTIIQPNQLFLVFGGGTLVGDFGDAIVQKASTTSLSLNNNGDRIIIRDSLNELVFFHEFEEEGNANQSLVLCPITTDGNYMEHSAIEAGTMLSPGQLHVCSLVSTLPEIYEKTIQIYPNPTNDFLTVNFSDELVLEKIDLLNSQGKSLLSTFDPYFYVTSLPKGVYFLRLKTDKGIIVKKVIVD